MDRQLLLRRISERLAVLKMSEREVEKLIGHARLIGNLRDGADSGVAKIQALATALGCPVGYFLGEINDFSMDMERSQGAIMTGARTINLKTQYIVGDVQAGHWLEAVERPPGEWEPVRVPIDSEYDRYPAFGLVLHGNSMDREYADGTVLMCVKISDLGRAPDNGEHVIVYRRRGGLVEATVKEYVITPENVVELWPRSESKEFSSPISLQPENGFVDGDQVEVHALVIGSYTPRKRAKK